MAEKTPQSQPGWIPSRDYLGRRPIVESWPGLRPEIKRTWEALAKAAAAACIVATSGEWFDFFGLSMSGFRARLRSMADLGLIRWSMAEDGSRRITIELVDPLLLDRRPVGTAARYSRPRAVVGSFERQVPLFSAEAVESRQPLRLAICEEAEAEHVQLQPADPVQLQPADPAQLQGPEAEHVQLQKPPDGRSFPPAILPQCPAGAGACAPALILTDLTDMNDLMMSNGGEDAETGSTHRVPGWPQSGTAGANTHGLDGEGCHRPVAADGRGRYPRGENVPHMTPSDQNANPERGASNQSPPGPPPVDPVEALSVEDFQRRLEEVTDRANRLVARVWRVEQRAGMSRDDKLLILKVCFLALARPCAPYGPTWLDDAIDRVCTSKARTTLKRPSAYLHQVLRKGVDGAGRKFPCDLAVLDSVVSRDLFTPPARASPDPAALAAKDPQPGLPWIPPTPEMLAEGRAAIAAALAGMKTSRAIVSSQSPNPSLPTPKGESYGQAHARSAADSATPAALPRTQGLHTDG